MASGLSCAPAGTGFLAPDVEQIDGMGHMLARLSREKLDQETINANRPIRTASRAYAESLESAKVKFEDASWAANVAHRKQINGEALADVFEAIKTAMPPIAGDAAEPARKIAKAVVTAIVKGEIRHCKVEY